MTTQCVGSANREKLGRVQHPASAPWIPAFAGMTAEAELNFSGTIISIPTLNLQAHH